ncbi:hypothetical protein ACM66B_006588 [Microbotryomycetes sp. NB124-2]
MDMSTDDMSKHVRDGSDESQDSVWSFLRDRQELLTHESVDCLKLSKASNPDSPSRADLPEPPIMVTTEASVRRPNRARKQLDACWSEIESQLERYGVVKVTAAIGVEDWDSPLPRGEEGVLVSVMDEGAGIQFCKMLSELVGMTVSLDPQPLPSTWAKQATSDKDDPKTPPDSPLDTSNDVAADASDAPSTSSASASDAPADARPDSQAEAPHDPRSDSPPDAPQDGPKDQSGDSAGFTTRAGRVLLTKKMTSLIKLLLYQCSRARSPFL